jgi:transcriptional regulator with XRE-family HTH domain
MSGENTIPLKAKPTSPKTITDLDRLIANQLRRRRESLHQSLEHVASQLRITASQLYKYERAENRIPASRLPTIAAILNVSITYFFDEDEAPERVKRETLQSKIDVAEFATDLDQAIEILEVFRSIPSGTERHRAISMMRHLVANPD